MMTDIITIVSGISIGLVIGAVIFWIEINNWNPFGKLNK